MPDVNGIETTRLFRRGYLTHTPGAKQDLQSFFMRL